MINNEMMRFNMRTHNSNIATYTIRANPMFRNMIIVNPEFRLSNKKNINAMTIGIEIAKIQSKSAIFLNHLSVFVL